MTKVGLTTQIERARFLLTKAKRVAFLTGAGLSAESGVPTFRGGGNSLVWRSRPFAELSSAQLVREDPKLLWEWFDYRLGVLAKCQPNAAHHTIAQVGATGWFETVSVVTQNVDGLHTAAGSVGVIELHGNIRVARCTECSYQTEIEGLPDKVRPPECQECGAAMRPNVVLFGEFLDSQDLNRAQEIARSADVALVIGTSGLVYPANELPLITKSSGGKLIEINPEQTALTDLCDLSVRSSAAHAVPMIFEN